MRQRPLLRLLRLRNTPILRQLQLEEAQKALSRVEEAGGLEAVLARATEAAAAAAALKAAGEASRQAERRAEEAEAVSGSEHMIRCPGLLAFFCTPLR